MHRPGGLIHLERKPRKIVGEDVAIQIERDMGNESAEREYTNQLLEEFPDSDEARQLLERTADAGTR